MSQAAVIDVIRTSTFTYRDEDQLQEGIAAVLTEAGHDVHREVRLSGRDRLDVLAGDVCVEAKIAGTAERLMAQLRRYAEDARVGSIVVVTTRRRHRDLPESIGGKRVAVVRVGGAG